ncbi:MAG: hypothetical protein RKK11_14020 [Alphaproteobacteria bacterium]
MRRNVPIPEDLLKAAHYACTRSARTVPEQIEHWARLGKVAEENPDLPLSFIVDIIATRAESEKDPYHFSK